MSSKMLKSEKPFIIWTLQRTGGTNLTKFLGQRTSFGPIQQEPFNRPRIYGDIGKKWLATADDQELMTGIDTAISKMECIKHCIEMVPFRLSEVLAQRASLDDWRHLFLFRQDPLHRILSVEYARRTKVWGPGHKERARFDDDAFKEPLDVQKLITQERSNIERLNSIWKLVKEFSSTRLALCYEDIYFKDFDSALIVLSTVLSELGLSREEGADKNMLSRLRSTGDQKTRDRYQHFIGIERLRAELASLQPLDCNSFRGT